MQSVPQPILDLIGRANVRTVALSPRGNAWHMVSDEHSAVLRCSTQTLGACRVAPPVPASTGS